MKIFSLFTGGGGLDIGFHGGFTYLDKVYPPLRFRTKYAIELNRDACETLYHNDSFKETIILQEDIMEINPNLFKGEDFDVLIGGFPCQSFSIVGGRLGIKDDINGKLYQNFVSYIHELQPKVFVAENVKGILSANKGEAIKIITKEFEETGYNVQIALVNFADYGVPQTRQRVLFIGVRKDIKKSLLLPVPQHRNSWLTAEQALHNIPLTAQNQEQIKALKSTTAKLKAIPEGGNFKDLPPHLMIKAKMSNIYRRLNRDKPSYTILASGGGGTWTYHYEEPRALTNRERARIQSFPDNYVFYGSVSEVRRQIGNAVPPVGIYPFAVAIQDLLTN